MRREKWEAGQFQIGCEIDGRYELVLWNASNKARRTESNQAVIYRTVQDHNAMLGIAEPDELRAALDELRTAQIEFDDAAPGDGSKMTKLINAARKVAIMIPFAGAAP